MVKAQTARKVIRGSAMPSFDYINSPEFRASLESDYKEMRTCAEAGAWKSAQVLAGSIVESLLVDYLTSTPNPARTQKDPLKLDLSEAISICRAEKALSDRSADLCSVVRSYRNLIHPGRMVRLNEPAPDRTTCDIAIALIDLIVGEIASTRRAAVGLTAEQILSKIMRDSDCVPILPHLLKEVTDVQRERLLLQLLPDAYFSLLGEADEFTAIPTHLSDAFLTTLRSSTDETRARVARRFVTILREEDGKRVADYRNEFFRADEMRHLSEGDQEMVKEHLIGAVGSTHTGASLQYIAGLAPFLKAKDCVKFLDPFVRTVLSESSIKSGLAKLARDRLLELANWTSVGVDEAMLKRLDVWHLHLKENGSLDAQQAVKSLRDDLAAVNIPF